MIDEPHEKADLPLPTKARRSPNQPFKIRTGPDGVHWSDRNSGLNVLFDEALVPKNRWSRAPRQVSIALTNACDVACGYCYAPKHPAVLDIDRLLAWARELDDEGCLGIGFGGGEPTLYWRLPQLCRSITETTSLAATLTSHGHRWNAELAEQLLGSVHFVRVSVDGVNGTYEKLRNRSFDDLLQRLQLTSGAFSVGINCVVNKSTLPELDAVAALAAEVGAAELLLLLERPTRTTPGANADVVAGLHDWIRGHQGSVPLSTGDKDADGLPTAQPLPSEVGLRSYAHIDATGNVRATSYSSQAVPIDHSGVLAAIKQLQGDMA